MLIEILTLKKIIEIFRTRIRNKELYLLKVTRSRPRSKNKILVHHYRRCTLCGIRMGMVLKVADDYKKNK
jgi:hypothetical protein